MKPKPKFLLLCSVAMSLMSCSEFDYTKGENSVTVTQGEISTQITVINDEIIHVNKRLVNAPEQRIPEYVVELEPQNVKWKVSERDGKLTIESTKIKASINQAGEVSYTTKSGEAIVSEMSDGTHITPNTPNDNSMAQTFTVGDEALYGLGQFQNGLINWKNTPVRLQQSNQEIAVPFLVSTAGYGIYWNNYSITEFNLPQNELKFTEVVDAKNKIKRGKFTPRKSGTHYFMVQSPTPLAKNRQFGAIELLLDKDTVLTYTTMWFPDAISGRADLIAGKEYEVTFYDTKAQVDDARVLYNEPDYNRTQFSNEHGEAIDYYLIYGDTPAEIHNSYTDLTGKAPMFPKSAFGFWHCREAYREQETLLYNAHEYRKRQIPVDNIVQDWDYWPAGTRCPHWDRTRYPDPAGMVKELADLNLKLMVSVWPAVDSKPLVERYALDKLEGKSYINAYDPAVSDRFYKMLSDSMYKIGVRSIWVDGSEPVFDPTPTYETGAGEYQQLQSIYSQRVLNAIYHGHRAEFPDERVINLTRSAFSGQQRYGAMVWSGDIDGSWEQYREQIPAGLNITMAGIPYWTTDIGGFFRNMTNGNTVEQDQYNDPNYIELLARWFEYGTFCPIFRIHGFKSETEVWRYGKMFEAIARKYIDLRYQLLPYIYSASRDVTTSGAVMMSPLAYLYPEDKATWNIDDQFMFGESILVSPVIEYKARTRELYLPKGEWFNLWTNERVKGGETITAKAELDEMPLFVKSGSIIPFGPKLQYATEPTTEPTVLKVYPGADAQFTLYLDDNTSNDNESGIYSEIEMTYRQSDNTLTLKSGNDKFVDFKSNPMKFIVEVAGAELNREVIFEGQEIVTKL